MVLLPLWWVTLGKGEDVRNSWGTKVKAEFLRLGQKTRDTGSKRVVNIPKFFVPTRKGGQTQGEQGMSGWH